jgi:hypothetical protein
MLRTLLVGLVAVFLAGSVDTSIAEAKSKPTHAKKASAKKPMKKHAKKRARSKTRAKASARAVEKRPMP